MKKILCIFLTMILAAMTAVPMLQTAAAGIDTAGAQAPVELIEGTYVPHQAVVLFDSAAIDTATAPRKGDLAAVGADFGDKMDASSSGGDAYGAADEELAILRSSLGSGFVLEDTLVFDSVSDDGGLAPTGASGSASAAGDMTIALVSSDIYDTAELIEKLSKNPHVVIAEPNYYTYPTSIEDYSLNDPCNSKLYNVNSPLAQNTGGLNVDSEGLDPADVMSINASSGWAKLSGDEDEVVVAVIDSGVLYTHEDLKDVMWTNPGNIGLKGLHGYDFCDDDDDPIDENGHGTHCAGVIAAKANNGKGVAGVASAAKVRIMALRTMDKDGRSGSYIYDVYAAYHYIHKAIQAGVNVVAVNNSWGGAAYATLQDVMIAMLGEEGVISYNAASNEGKDNDRTQVEPANSESDYAVSVGAADIEGIPAFFTNYGRTSVDVFGPGLCILSATSEDIYLPTYYDAQTLNATTEYYGEFNADTVVTDGTITPSTGRRAGEDIKSFGSLRFVKQRNPGIDEDYVIPDDAELELTVADGDFGHLIVTVKNAQYGENYFVYFPYEKNPLTTGDDNTEFSILGRSIYCEDGYEGTIRAGEVANISTGCCFTLDSRGLAGTDAEYRHDRFNATKGKQSYLIGWEKLKELEQTEEVELGLGCYIFSSSLKEGESHDVSFIIESLAVSKPNVVIEPGTSYEIMSGTSMATPAVSGAGALLAALYPRQEGESGGDYARRIKAILFSCVHRTEILEDLCSTGGYVDLSLLGEGLPAITDAVCGLEDETLTLTGANLYEGSTLTYRRMAIDGAEDQPLPDGMTVEYAADGSKLVIHNAKSLFSTYTAFTVTAENGMAGTGKFFLVKGQNKPEVIQQEFWENRKAVPYLLTDTDGRNLYGYDKDSGQISYYDGAQFNIYKNTGVIHALKEYLIAGGADRFETYNTNQTKRFAFDVPTCEKGVIYDVLAVLPPEETEADSEEAPDEATADEPEEEEAINRREAYYLATFDLNGTDRSWHFSPLADLPEGLWNDNGTYLTFGILEGKLVFIGGPDNFGATDSSLPAYSYDPAAGEWSELPDLPYVTDFFDIVQSNGKLYVMFGFDMDKTKPNEERILSEVWCFDGEKWEQKRDDLKYVGRINDDNGILFHSDAITAVKNGLIFFNASVDGGGNLFLYNTDTDEIEPLYYSVFDSLCDARDQRNSCVATRDGIYFLYDSYGRLGEEYGWYLCLIPADSGLYEDPFAPDGLMGDVDGDGEVTVLDATAIQRTLASLPVDSFNEQLADVDGDGEVTVLDATAIQRYLAGLPSPLDPPAPDSGAGA